MGGSQHPAKKIGSTFKFKGKGGKLSLPIFWEHHFAIYFLFFIYLFIYFIYFYISAPILEYTYTHMLIHIFIFIFFTFN